MNARLTVDDADLARADAYALLAHLFFAAPSAALLDAMRQMGDGRADTETDTVSAAWSGLCNVAADPGADEVSIRDEFDALFVSIGKPQVSLYASWYLTGFLMEKPLALLRDDLAAMGLARRDDRSDPEDHVAGELEVMRHLVMSEEADAQCRFFQRHLQPWYGDFCAALEAAPDSRFYRAAARFMRAFLDMERDYFRLQAADGGVK